MVTCGACAHLFPDDHPAHRGWGGVPACGPYLLQPAGPAQVHLPTGHAGQADPGHPALRGIWYRLATVQVLEDILPYSLLAAPVASTQRTDNLNSRNRAFLGFQHALECGTRRVPLVL